MAIEITYSGLENLAKDVTRTYSRCQKEPDIATSIFEDEESEYEMEQECPICQILYENSEYLARHFKAHQNSQNKTSLIKIQNQNVPQSLSYFVDTYFLCGKCPEKFLNRDDYKAHMLHHKTEFHCELCAKTYNSKTKLLKHHGKEHVPSQKCFLCLDKFFSKKDLKVHIKKNHFYPFKCQKCGKGFKTQKKYKSHIKHPKCPNKCKECGRSFAQKAYLKTHMKNVHKLIYEED